MAKTIFHRGNSYGVMGERTGFTPKGRIDSLKVGDLVTFKFKHGNADDWYEGIVVKYGQTYTIMGAVGDNLSEFKEVRKVLDYTLVSNDIVESLHNMGIVDSKRMTKKQIEEALGYPIEIVGG